MDTLPLDVSGIWLRVKELIMDLLEEVFQLLESATKLEKSNNRIEAATKYYEASYLMRQALHHTPRIFSFSQPQLPVHKSPKLSSSDDEEAVANGTKGESEAEKGAPDEVIGTASDWEHLETRANTSQPYFT